MSAPLILGSSSIMDYGGSLLDAGRRINRSGIGMSASSRGLLEGFFNSATGLFNQLYNKAENGEASNAATILALRSKYSYLVDPEVAKNTPPSTPGSTFYAGKLDSDTQAQIRALQSRYGNDGNGIVLPAATSGTSVNTTA